MLARIHDLDALINGLVHARSVRRTPSVGSESLVGLIKFVMMQIRAKGIAGPGCH